MHHSSALPYRFTPTDLERLEGYKTRIAIDGMGGDGVEKGDDHLRERVRTNIEGVSLFARNKSAAVILTGNGFLHDELNRRYRCLPPNIFLCHAEQVCPNDKRFGRDDMKHDYSITTATELVVANLKNGEPIAHATISAGSSSVAVGVASIILGRMHRAHEQTGLKKQSVKPAVVSMLPSGVLLLDTGASPELKTKKDFLNLAAMGLEYRKVLMNEPVDHIQTVGLLNLGTEEWKGGKLLNDTHGLLTQELGDAFVGNVEGYDLWGNKAGVIVCDAIVGNPVIKSNKGQPRYWVERVINSLNAHRYTKLLGWPADKIYHRLMKYLNRTGGAPVLGVRGAAYICNSEASARDIENALVAAANTDMKTVIQRTQERLDPNGGEAP